MLHQIEHAFLHALEHTCKDNLSVIVILFLTYLVMEYLEHHTGNKIQKTLQRAGKAGPLLGAVAGVIPQCGLSAAASNLYAGRVITMGTLIAIYLSTSDEMLPVMISAQAPVSTIVGILAAKLVIGAAAGFLLDMVSGQKKKGQKEKDQKDGEHIHEICEQEHCECEKGIFHSAVKHTLQVGAFIVLISLVLNFALEMAGEETIAALLLNRPVLGPIVSGLVGLIPNCAASVAITELYLGGMLGAGSMLAGLLVGAGVGLLVLVRVNHHKWENLKIVGILYGIGVFVGIVVEFLMR